LLVAACLIRAHSGLAAQGTTLEVTSAGCEPSFESEVLRITQIELRSAITSPLEVPPTTVHLTCRLHEVDLEVSDAVREGSTRKTVSLIGAAREGYARLIALSATELILARLEAAESQEKSPVASAPLPPPPPPEKSATRRLDARPPLPESERASRFPPLFAMASGRVFPVTGPVLLGGSLATEPTLFHHWVLEVDAEGLYGRVSRSLGDVSTIDVDGSVGLGWRWSWSKVAATVLVRGRVGYVWMSGTPSTSSAAGRSIAGPFLGPECAVRVVPWPSFRLHPVLELSIGDAALGVQADVAEGSKVAISGFMSGLSIGIGFDP
jgi:hypothetical protein